MISWCRDRKQKTLRRSGEGWRGVSEDSESDRAAGTPGRHLFRPS